uniref:Sodium/nucleoside cotransporter n=1 Tax=Syphacia muris TaxID=451379 RepID=A0A0N5AE59_9BILA
MQHICIYRQHICLYYTENHYLAKLLLYGLIFLAANIWLIFSLINEFHKALPLLIFMAIAWIALLYETLKRLLKKCKCNDAIESLFKSSTALKIRRVIQIVIGLGLLIYIVYLSIETKVQVMSLMSLIIMVLLSVICSKHPSQIKWTPVVWGLYLQYFAAFLVLKWQTGSTAFRWATEQFVRFLSYTNNGTSFVFGFIPNPPNICGVEGPFSFTSLPIIIFFGSLCSAFYYLGVVQWFLIRVATLLHYTMQTTAAESLNAAASIFLGPTEAAVMMRMSLPSMTESEILATMTAGFAMISGSLFALYIGFGACAAHLLAANMMSAPAVLTVSKIFYPEIQKSKQRTMKDFHTEQSVLESISSGAVQAVSVIFAIIVNLIVFLAIVALIDNVVYFATSSVGFEDITFNKLLGYLFFPLAYVMGVSNASDESERIAETLRVAQLIGTKTLLNEFIAYQQMSEMLLQNQLTGRAQMMALFACCGYSNISQIGSQLGIFGAMAPNRKRSFARMAIRSLVAGSIACFMTAAVAGPFC